MIAGRNPKKTAVLKKVLNLDLGKIKRKINY